jgi:hypothetical protein
MDCASAACGVCKLRAYGQSAGKHLHGDLHASIQHTVWLPHETCRALLCS